MKRRQLGELEPREGAKKLQRRIKVDFTREQDQDAIAMASAGQSNQSIVINTGLTTGQVNYRVKRDRVLMERDKDPNFKGLRYEWRSGRSPLFRQFMEDYRAVLRADVRARLTPKLIHPPLEASPKGRRDE